MRLPTKEPLLVLARHAEDAAHELKRFQNFILKSTEIGDLITLLYSISTASKKLESLTVSRRYKYNYPRVKDDLSLVRQSLTYTLEKLLDFLRDVYPRWSETLPDAFYRVFVDMSQYFCKEGNGYSLGYRLETYRAFVCGLQYKMREYVSEFPFRGQLLGFPVSIVTYRFYLATL